MNERMADIVNKIPCKIIINLQIGQEIALLLKLN